jgi:drug/metabolite transporter (DMT)-like permease
VARPSHPTAPRARTQRTQFGIALMLAAVLNFASMEAIAKFLIGDYPVPMIAWSRWAFHFAICLPFFLAPRNVRFLRTRRPVMHTLRPLILVTATFSFFGALTEMQLATTTALVFTAPLIVTALSPLLLSEVVGMRRRIAVLVGFAGVLVILRPSPHFDNWIALLPLLAGACYAAYQLATRHLSGTEPAMTQFFYVGLGGLVATSVIVPFFWKTPSAGDWGLLALSGLFGLVAQFLTIKAFEAADASIVSPFLYTQIIWATLYGFVLFGDLPDLWTVAGAAIVVASGIYIWSRERRRFAKPAR